MHSHIGLHLNMLIIMALSVSCGRGHSSIDMPGDMVARVGSSVLTMRDVESVMPFGLSEDDSVKFVRGYVRTWIDNVLVGELALKNIPDSKTIDKMVEDYRRELIMWEYRKMMFEKLAPQFFNEDSLRNYYENHSEVFVTEAPLIRGILVKVPASDAHIKDVKRWYKSDRSNDLENLEKYAFSDTVDYDYFREDWTAWDAIKSRLPVDKGVSPDQIWNNGKTLELSNNGYVYLLSLSDYLPAKSKMPYEIAVEDIKDRLANERRISFDRELKRGLYKDGIESGEIELKISID